MAHRVHRSIVIVQHAGDYTEVYRRLCSGGGETYYAQRYSVDVVGALVSPTTTVTTICCTAERDEDSVLQNGVRSINVHSDGRVDERRVWDLVRRCGATHLLLRAPQMLVLQRALADPAIESVLLTLADSFRTRGAKAWLHAWRLRRLLNHPKVAWVGNHGVNSSESLRRVGVDPARIVPWDWPHEVTPHQAAPKAIGETRPWKLLFVGALMETKGLGDLMRAVRALSDRGIPVRLAYAGRGDFDRFRALAASLGITDRVDCLGMVAHAAVVPLMRDADVVVVPSRHEYPEGFPMTIYEALASRTPIVASDHPMYGPHLKSTGAALVYAAGDHRALADAIEKLAGNASLYQAVSNASAAAWDQLQLPITWGRQVETWLSESPAERANLLSQHSLRGRSGLAA